MEKEELLSVYIMVLNFRNVNLMKYCIEQGNELRAVTLQFKSVNICV
jgi:hypothetical protein